MGRDSTGAPIVEGTMRISISYFLQKGYIRKGYIAKGILQWTGGGNVLAESHYSDREKYIRLTYTSKGQGYTQNHDYKIRLVAKPSNLGKGDVLYFVCPESNRLCRTLFFSSRTRTFVCRQAYPRRLFYRSQLSSKLSKANDQFWSIKRILEDLAKRKETFAYNGKRTRYALRVERLLEKQRVADYLRWMPQSMPLSLRREIKRLMFSARNP